MHPSAFLRQSRLFSAISDRPLQAGILVALIVVNIIYLFAYELRVYPKLIYIAFVVSLFATFHVVTRRVLFSLFMATAIPFALAAFSLYKFNVQARTLHVADLFLMQVSGAKYLAGVDHGFAVATGAAMLGTVAVGLSLFKVDARSAFNKESPSIRALLGCYLGLVGLLAMDRWYGSEIHNVNRYHISAFLRSVQPMNEFYSKHRFYAREAQNDPAYTWQFASTPNRHQPHVIYILDESAFRFEGLVDFPDEEKFAEKYTSTNRRTYSLGVEHFGAGTSMTELSMMTPLSTRPLGPWQWILPDVAMNKIHSTIMQAVNQVGYKSVCVYPSDGDYFNFENFYMTLGFNDFIDKSDMNAPTPIERDKFYLDNALNVIAKSQGPLFLSVVLSSNHYPWFDTLFPDVSVDGLENIVDGPTREYVRRSIISQADYVAFAASLRRVSPNRDVIVVRYGDHQPNIAKKMREAVGMPGDADMYTTYVTFDVVSEDEDRKAAYLEKLPQTNHIDAPFVSTTVLSIIGLNNPIVERVNRLRDDEDGRYYRDPASDSVLSHEGAMLGSGLVQLK